MRSQEVFPQHGVLPENGLLKPIVSSVLPVRCFLSRSLRDGGNPGLFPRLFQCPNHELEFFRCAELIEFGGIIGFALICNYLWFYVLVVGAIPLGWLMIVVEERELKERFGSEYQEYSRRVPRFLPRRTS